MGIREQLADLEPPYIYVERGFKICDLRSKYISPYAQKTDTRARTLTHILFS